MRRFIKNRELPFIDWIGRSFPFLPLFAELAKLSVDMKISDDWFSADELTNSKTLLSFDRMNCKMDCWEKNSYQSRTVETVTNNHWSLTWLDTLAELANSRFNTGIWDFRKGRTYGRNGKLTDSCKACLNSSVDKLPLCNFSFEIGFRNCAFEKRKDFIEI